MDSKQIFKSIQNSLEKLDKIHVFSEYTNVGKIPTENEVESISLRSRVPQKMKARLLNAY